MRSDRIQASSYETPTNSSCDHVYDQIPPLIYYSTDGLTVRGTFGPTMCITRHIHWNILGNTSTAQFAHSKYHLSLFVQTTEHSHIFLTGSKINSNMIATYIPPIHWTTQSWSINIFLHLIASKNSNLSLQYIRFYPSRYRTSLH